MKKKKLKRSKKPGVASMVKFKTGDKLVTETVSTRSEADIVWQDGRVETSVPSADLYPVQHLDDQVVRVALAQPL